MISDSDNSLDTDPQKIKRIVVLGGGSAGFLVALALKKHLPEIPLVVVRSTKMGVIGVGEGTIWSVVNFLHRFLGIDVQRFHQQAKPTIKLGIHYLWGSRPFFNYTFSPQFSSPLDHSQTPRGYFCKDECDYADIASALMTHDKVCLKQPSGAPAMVNSYAYHLENRLFVSLLEQLADDFGIDKIDDVVTGVDESERGIERLHLESGTSVEGDLFVDASGFRAELIGKTLDSEFVDFNDVLYCNAAVFGGWERADDEPIHPYTTAETMNSGWSWQIEHDRLVNRGYVYCTDFISEEDAVDEFKKRNPRIGMTKSIKFRAGVRRNTWMKNVIAVGNSAGFVEPLEATAIGMICDASINIVRAIKASGGQLPSETVAQTYSRIQFENWEIIRDFLALHYRFNHRLDTPFWKACTEDVPLGRTQPIVDYYQDVGPDLSLIQSDLKRDFFDAEGYLSMLVGQDVPYQRQVEFSAKDKHQWKIYKDNLRDSMYNAMDMREYLEFVRGQETGPQGETEYTVQSESVGELQWH